MKMMTYAMIKVVAVTTGILAGGIIVVAATGGVDGQTVRDTADAAGQSRKPTAVDAVKQTGEGLDCMKRMADVGNALGGVLEQARRAHAT